MKRYISFILALFLCLPLLAGCGKHIKLTVVEDGACAVLYDATQLTEDQAKNFINRIESTLGVTVTLTSTADIMTGTRIKAGTILLGAVESEACRQALSGMRSKDFAVGVYGEHYVIAGTESAATLSAMEYFRKNVLPEKEKKSLTLNSKNNYRYEGKYNLNGVTVGGEGLGSFEIVVPNSASVAERRLAVAVQRLILQHAGFRLPIVTLRHAGVDKQIRIGASICEGLDIAAPHSFDIAVDGSVMQVAAESFLGYEAATLCFKDEILKGTREAYPIDNSFSYSGSGASLASQPLESTGDVRLLFNNIWNGSTGDPAQRAEMQVALYAEYLPDVIGLQECSPTTRYNGIHDLKSLGYAEVPVDPDLVAYGKETLVRTPLFYRTDTLELMAHGYRALNGLEFWDEAYKSLYLPGVSAADLKTFIQNPHNNDSYKYGPDEDGSKGVCFAIFRVKATGNLIMVGSTHLWWQGRHDLDDTVRIIQMDVMKNWLAEEAARFLSDAGISGEMPIFIGGDYNTRSTRQSYASMSRGLAYDDVNTLVEEGRRLTEATVHSYPTYDDELKLWTGMGTPSGDYGNSLDYIFAARTARHTYEISHIGMLTEDYAFLTSDHSPIFLDLAFTATAPVLPVT